MLNLVIDKPLSPSPFEQARRARELENKKRNLYEAELIEREVLAKSREDAISELKKKGYFRPARPDEYEAWLRGYIESGGKITHAYQYPMPNNFHVANLDFELPSLCGASAIELIVPCGVTISGIDIGHCNLYKMDGFKYRGFGWFPIYTNVLQS
jgi:hypothetical protein